MFFADEGDDEVKSADTLDAAGDTVVFRGDELKVYARAQKAWRSAEVGKSRTIRAHIGESVKSIQFNSEEAVTLGRVDDAHDSNPDVDLMEYGALQEGVSRIHAALRFRGDMMEVRDLNSTNGTFLNGQRVSAKDWRIVRDGDELGLGTLVMVLRFGGE